MTKKNINSTKMKENNVKLVLNTVRSSGLISRSDLAKSIGTTSATITNIVNDLIKRGYLCETGLSESSGGRRPILLGLNPTAGYIIGLELTVTEIYCIITDFKATVLYTVIEEVNLNNGKEYILNQVVRVIERIIEKSCVRRENIMGVGLVSAGPYDYEKGIMINPPNFHGWKNVHIKEIVQGATGLDVFFERETPAAALGECWFGKAKTSKNLFLISVFRVGIGGSLIFDGNIYHGFRDGAGDIGHMTIDLNGVKCTCGSYGCLEAMADANAAINRLKIKLKTNTNLLNKYNLTSADDINFDFLTEQEQRGDERCADEIIACANYIGTALLNVINLYSPDTIVLAGEFVNKSPLLVETIIKKVHSREYLQQSGEISIYKSGLGEKISALGGVAIVLERFFK